MTKPLQTLSGPCVADPGVLRHQRGGRQGRHGVGPQEYFKEVEKCGQPIVMVTISCFQHESSSIDLLFVFCLLLYLRRG